MKTFFKKKNTKCKYIYLDDLLILLKKTVEQVALLL